jgi:hypothetical protein
VGCRTGDQQCDDDHAFHGFILTQAGGLTGPALR